jgi:hypothetical protein
MLYLILQSSEMQSIFRVKIEAAGSYATLVPICQTTWCHVSEDHNLNIYHFEDHISHVLAGYS